MNEKRIRVDRVLLTSYQVTLFTFIIIHLWFQYGFFVNLFRIQLNTNIIRIYSWEKINFAEQSWPSGFHVCRPHQYLSNEWPSIISAGMCQTVEKELFVPMSRVIEITHTGVRLVLCRHIQTTKLISGLWALYATNDNPKRKKMY